MVGHGPTVDVDVLLAVASAVRDTKRLRADYLRHDGTENRRLLEPHRIVHSRRRWYLLAWDVDRADWRTFRLDRLTPRTPTGPRFTPRQAPDPDIAGYTSRGVTTDAYRYRSRITVHAPAEVVAEHIGPTVGVVTPINDNSCELCSGSNSMDEMALWAAIVGAELTIHEPAELREHMATLGARLLRATDLSTPLA
ncbi:MAG: WYL domain-containing protein [Sporichthyaceae bacterium]|nr:WYL domain-containing protein [Sporichthyaceae bacterium]